MIVKNNFVNFSTGEPTTVEIQRIFLDMLDHNDPNAPTDGVHKFRMKFFLAATKKGKGYVVSEKGQEEIKLSKKERLELITLVKSFCQKLKKGEIFTFNKTDNLLRCKYCFLPDCEQI
jgi:hypothetical protein